jgi:N-acetylated-alpha-linked acidic dipeptidase
VGTGGWYNQVYATGGFESQGVTMQRVNYNGKIASFESDLLDVRWAPTDTEVHGVSLLSSSIIGAAG